MPKFLVSVSYTGDGAKGLRKDGGTKRRQVAANAVESLGGKIESFYFCFGEHDATSASWLRCSTGWTRRTP